MFSFTKFLPNISNWNTSNVTNMSGMFQVVKTAFPDISTKQVILEGKTYTAWDTSKVTNMSYMFRKSYFFNQEISNWNVSSVKTMNEMFYSASLFNQDLSKWNPKNE